MIARAEAARRSFDIVVLGGGLAGAVAAKKAAEDGKRVALVRGGGGATCHSSGAFDVASEAGPLVPGAPGAGGTAAAPMPLRELIARLLARNPYHPYALVAAGDPGAVAGLLEEASDDLFRDLDEEGLLYRGSLARNLWVATPGGHVKETAFAQEAIAAGDLAALPKARIAVVAIGDGATEGGAAPLVEAKARAAALRRALDARQFFGVRELIPVAVGAPPRGAGRAPDDVTTARALDDPAALGAWAKEVARALEAQAPRATHVLMPPVLGLREPGAAVAILKGETGREIAETVALPPSVPGLRLERALARVLERKGVEVIAGRASHAEAAGAALRRVRVEDRDGGIETLEGRAFILASGRYLGGGLREGNRTIEPLFDLPLYHRGRPIEELGREEWFDRHIVSAHPAMSFGVRCGADLRPIGRGGGPAFENLFAAGAAIASGSFVTDRAGLGAALATGYVAGLNAAEVV